MNFLYYLPNQRNPLTVERLREAGLGHAFESSERHQVPCKGPDGGEGLFAAPSNAAGVGYYPDKQTWQKAIGQDYWVGIPNDWEPKPGDLVRRSVLDGLEVQLADDNFWIVPRARQYNGNESAIEMFVTLPHVLGCDDDGNWTVGEVLPRWRHLQEVGDAFYDYHHRIDETEDAANRFDFNGIMNSACEVLRANYRIDRRECDMLRIINEKSAVDILRALIDDDSLNLLLKKKAAVDSLSSSDGPEDSTEEPTSQQ